MLNRLLLILMLCLCAAGVQAQTVVVGNSPFDFEAPAGGTFVLDETSATALAAWSLHKMTAGYSGPAVRLRRISDDDTADVCFDGSDVVSLSSTVDDDLDGTCDDGTLSTWVASGTAHVAIWYDQIAAYDVSQATAGQQPRLISGGTLDIGLNCDGDDDLLRTSIGLGSTLQLTGGGTVSLSLTHDGFGDIWSRIIDKSTSGSATDGWSVYLGGVAAGDNTTNRITGQMNGAGRTIQTTNTVYTTSVRFHATVELGASADEIYVEGSSVTTSLGTPVDPPNVATNMTICSWNHSTGREFDGKIDNIVVFGSYLSSADVTLLYNDTQ